MSEGIYLVPATSVFAGTRLRCDGGFTCLGEGDVVTVREDRHGNLYVPCACGQHDLGGQLDDDGANLVGFQLAGDA